MVAVDGDMQRQQAYDASIISGEDADVGASRRDKLLRSSLFLIAATSVTAGLGFAFWLAVARLYSPADVGVASSLISAATLIAFFAQLGLNGTVVRFMPSSSQRNAQITVSLYMVFGAACAMAVMYVLLAPAYTSHLEFLRQKPLLGAGFVIFSGLYAVNFLMGSVFVAVRKPEYSLLSDGLLGITKLALPIAFVSLGAYGIFTGAGIGFIVGAIASYYFMRHAVNFRAKFTRSPGIRRDHGIYSVASYVGNLLHMAPVMILPIIALHALSDAAAGYFYLAYQVANLIYAISYAVGQAVFAEGAYDECRLRHFLRRSGLIIAILQIPAVAVVVLFGPWVLSIIGAEYAQAGTTVLMILAAASVGVALNNWAGFVLNLTGLMRQFVIMNLIFCVLTLGIAEWLAPRGLLWLGIAWLIGSTVAGFYGCIALWHAMARRPSSLRLPSSVGEAQVESAAAESGNYSAKPTESGVAGSGGLGLSWADE